MESSSNKTMLAFVITPNEESKVKEIPIPIPPTGHALIHVLRAGVCNTDLELMQGYMGFQGVLGHEFVGRVVEMNTSDDSLNESFLGERVCGDINVGCDSKECFVCQGSLDSCCSKMSRNHCPNRTVLGILNHNGTMAEYLTLPISNLHKVPPEMTDETAVFAEPLAAACRIVEQKLTKSTDKVAILGDGKLGLMIAEVIGREALDTRPILFGKHQHKLDLVKDIIDCKFVSEVIDKKAFGGVAAPYASQFDVVVDATGSPAGLSLCAGLCRPMGTLVLKSTCAAGEKFNAAPFVIDELHVVGSRCGPVDKALELLPEVNVNKYVTKTFPLSQAAKAIACAAEKTTMKVQILCSEQEEASEEAS
mmetsp:Transcript_10533/g.16083  ORF Transcript_10533/g.16083 Transcript_10533/m.16083 type:complete len:364 (-) Transcript_10533:55-1146(-)